MKKRDTGVQYGRKTMQCSRFLLREAAAGRSGGEPGLITEGI